MSDNGKDQQEKHKVIPKISTAVVHCESTGNLS